MNKLLLFLSTAFLFISCDKINCPYEEGCDVLPADTSLFKGINDTSIGITTFRKLFIEEFTGYACNNCPEGAAKIKNMLLTLGDTMIPVSVHAGYFANPSQWPDEKGFIKDYRTEAGEYYNGLFGIESNPSAVINRKKFNNEYPVKLNSWESRVNNEIQNNLNILNFEMKSIFNEEHKVGKVEINGTFLNNYNNPISACFYLIENHVIGVQDDHGTIVPDYSHEHMLRSAYGTPLGRVISNGSVSANDVFNISSANLFFSDEWNRTNCEVIAIIYDANTFEVLNCNIVHLIN